MGLTLSFCMTFSSMASITELLGTSHLVNVHYDDLISNGFIDFENLFIDNLLKSNGTLRGKNLKCQTLKTNGQVKIDDVLVENIQANGSFMADTISVSQTAQFNGQAQIKKGTIKNVIFSGKRLSFSESNISRSITMKKSNNNYTFLGFKIENSDPVILELKERSRVVGDIIFEEEGEVHLSKDSYLEGKIHNGKVINI